MHSALVGTKSLKKHGQSFTKLFIEPLLGNRKTLKAKFKKKTNTKQLSLFIFLNGSTSTKTKTCLLSVCSRQQYVQ